MSIGGVKPVLLDTSTQGGGQRASAEAADFAAVARRIAEGDLEAARTALRAAQDGSATAATLAQSLDAGNLAAARLALSQLGVDPYAGGASNARALAQPVQASAPAAGGPVVVPDRATLPPGADTKIAANAPPAAPQGQGVVADVGSVVNGGSSGVAGATVTAANGATYRVADVMLALATGNAGTIPADVINLYGPGGARYDPAAIMDAYRSSDIGKAQMAHFAWMTRPA